VSLITYTRLDERDMRDFKSRVVRVDTQNRIREQATIA
jgi:aspartate 1-decarboxylase